MTTITNVILIDDLDGGEASGTVRFALDGQPYEIDLSDPNAEALRGSLARYIEAGRKAANGQPTRRGSRPRGGNAGTIARGVPAAAFRPPDVNGDQPLTPAERAQLREWAATRPDVKVAERGRIAATVIAEWRAATGRTA